MSDPIANSLQSSDLNVVALQDPSRIQFLVSNLANQINDARMAARPPKQCIDLSEHIVDVIIETSVQGASMLEVHVIDPGWVLLQRDENGVCFIDVDEAGDLWPPIEVNFPPNVSDATWRLCQVQLSTDVSQANVVLVFEDKIVAELREHSGPVSSNPNETRAEFIRRLVKQASANPLVGGDVGIRFIPLLPNSAFTAADLTATEAAVPASAKQPNPPPARKNPSKHAGGPVQQGVSSVAQAVNGTVISIVEGTGFALTPLQRAVHGQGYIPGLGTYEPTGP